MNDLPNHEQAIELLQELGLKEYEAKAFVALTRLPQGTAKEISEISEVPRTRVYDAVRVLETKGLVEIQHANPQRFRAVSIDEAAETLRREYEERTDSLRATLRKIEPAAPAEETEVTHEVWALSGGSAITSRTQQLVDESDDEVILVIGDESAYTPDLQERLQAAGDRGVSVVIGITEESLRERVERDLRREGVRLRAGVAEQLGRDRRRDGDPPAPPRRPQHDPRELVPRGPGGRPRARAGGVRARVRQRAGRDRPPADVHRPPLERGAVNADR
jgi:sugar-specific transcriptional regulator TrmB